MVDASVLVGPRHQLLWYLFPKRPVVSLDLSGPCHEHGHELLGPHVEHHDDACTGEDMRLVARRVPGVNDALADDVAETDIAVDAREPTLPLVMEVAALTHAPHCPTIFSLTMQILLPCSVSALPVWSRLNISPPNRVALMPTSTS